MFESDEIVERTEFKSSQEPIQLHQNGNGVDFTLNDEKDDTSKLACSSPLNGSLKPPEISMNNISVINNDNDNGFTSPINRESFQSVCSENDSSMYKTAYDQTYDQTDFVLALNGTNLMEEHVIANDSNLLTSKADIHQFDQSPSPTFTAGDSTLLNLEDNSAIHSAGEIRNTPDVSQATPSPILSPSPQGFELEVSSNEGEKLEADVVSTGLQLESGFKSESGSDSGSPSAFDFCVNTCSPFIQHQDSSHHQEAAPEEAEEAVAPHIEQSQKLEKGSQNQEEKQQEEEEEKQLQSMLPPVESTAPCNTKGLEIEDIEEPKIFTEHETVIDKNQAETEPLIIDDHSTMINSEKASNPFEDFNQPLDNVVQSEETVFSMKRQESPEIITKDLDQIDTNSRPTTNFNQVILESMAISKPVTTELEVSTNDPSSNGDENVHFGFSSSFNEDTVIENRQLLKDNGDSDDGIIESSNQESATKFQEESDDSDSSQDSVKENMPTASAVLSVPSDVEIMLNNQVDHQETVELDEPTKVELVQPIHHNDVLLEDCLLPVPTNGEDVKLPASEQVNVGQLNEEVFGQPEQEEFGFDVNQIEKGNNQNEVFTNHELCGTESENEVRNCDEGMNVNGSPSFFVEDNHDVKETKEGSITTTNPFDQQEQQAPNEVTNDDTKNDYERREEIESEIKGEINLQSNAPETSSPGNISKIEMPSPMRMGLVDLNETNIPSDDMNQWGAPSLLLGQPQQSILSPTAMSEASPLVENIIGPNNTVPPLEMKPELMIDIMNGYKTFTPEKVSTPTEHNQKPLSPKQPQQVAESVPDLIVESKSVDLKKAVAGRAKISRSKPKAAAPDVQKNTSKPPLKTAPKSKPAVSSAPKPSSTTSRVTATRQPIVNSTTRTSTSTAPRKAVTAPPKPTVSRTTTTASSSIAARTQPSTARTSTVPRAPTTTRPALSNGVKPAAARPAVSKVTSSVASTTRPAVSNSMTARHSTSVLNRPPVVSKRPPALTKSTSSTSSLRPSVTKNPVSTSNTEMTKTTRVVGSRLAGVSTKTSTATRSAIPAKPATTGVAPRAVKKPIKSEATSSNVAPKDASNETH